MLKVRKYFLIDKIKYVFFFCTKLLYELLDYKYVMWRLLYMNIVSIVVEFFLERNFYGKISLQSIFKSIELLFIFFFLNY